MDIEARNKFCGLLMFNTSPASNKAPGSRSNDHAMHNYVSSFSGFIDQPEPYYKSLDYTQESSIAAGAAAPGDKENNNQPGCQKAQAEKRPPRPPNAFILYRREKQPAILAANRHLTNAEISRHIADLWRNESNETRLKWERFADQTKLEHMKAYPNYVYRPNKSKGKRRPGRKQPAASTTPEQSTSPVISQQEGSSTAGPVRPSTRGQNRVNMLGRRLELESQTLKMAATDFQSMLSTAVMNPITPPLESANANTIRFDPLNMAFTDGNVSADEIQLTPITPVSAQQQLMDIETLGQWRMVPTQTETVENQGNILFQQPPIFHTFHQQTVDPSVLFLNNNDTAPTIYDHPPTYPQDSKNVSPQKTNNIGDTDVGFSEFRDSSTVHNPVIADLLSKLEFDNFFGGAVNTLNSNGY
ncbi:11448_t:CDS:1 [Acaulospora morrowiae]|uniref:11448_t:CDS:1 n=1 Tax=Acaulospora morrowiae TaxID=94023 RepID=A0A9N9C3W4_9GLOM|nr:11448_t:CDS:1 [Acaulospora morrowiae]